MKTYTIKTKNHIVEYTIVRKKVKNLKLKVKTDLTVEVVANKYVSVNYIHEFVEKNLDWLLSTKSKIEEKTLIKKITYIDDDIIYFLGSPYKIKLVLSTENNIQLNDDIIYFNLTQAIFDNFEAKEKLLENWYRKQASEIYSERLKIIFPLMKNYKISYPDIKLRKMKSCWGTCHYTKGFIVLNTLLIKYPLESIDYVILHELVHFIHNNHSKDFYHTLEQIMPEWKNYKAQLKVIL